MPTKGSRSEAVTAQLAQPKRHPFSEIGGLTLTALSGWHPPDTSF
jgi:hypothetical protein